LYAIKMKAIDTILILFMFLSCNSQKQQQSIRSRINHIDIKEQINKQCKNNNIPGLGIGLFDADSIITYSYGVRNTIDSTPIQPNDKFHIGSCTKSITSFVAARLVEKNLIDWDTKIKDLFPDKLHQINQYYWNKILADILSHRAGIRPFFKAEELQTIPDSIINYKGSKGRQVISRWLLTQEPIIDSNQKYIYSNAGYSLAATMLEMVSNKTWESLIEEEFYRVFGITGYFGHPYLSDLRQPQGHIIPAQWGINQSQNLIPLPDSLDYSLRFFEPSGDISLSVFDFSKYLQEILRALLKKGTKLRQDTYDYMFFGYDDYSMGWGNSIDRNLQYLSHDGSDMTFYCRVLICREKGYGLVILANSGTENTVNGIYEISGYINNKIKY